MNFIFLPLLLVVHCGIVHCQEEFATLGDGTTGGATGSTVSVCTEAELIAAVSGNIPRIVRVMCHIELTAMVKIGSNKSILGSSNNLDHGEDYYDGLLDMINGAELITVSWNKFHDHWKTSLIGNSDDNGHHDIGKLHVTFHHNYFVNCNSRLPSLRFGTSHIYNNYYHNVTGSAINSRMGAQVLVESNVFRNSKAPISTNLYSREEGFALERNNDFGGSEIDITQFGSFTSPPYTYRTDRLSKVPYLVQRNAGRLKSKETI
ncbi:Pectate lyase A [Pseudolycoriella hygida]|uniref:Pectate lyase A n=1 Tax=Pseudolycoriella hygida TaxID=35572 RepID=A0A9Q0NES5_9DIPT|nr:Pectate lyase A [Pseudolycoriella hygida]